MARDITRDPAGVLAAVAGAEVPPSLPTTLPRPASGSEIAQFVAMRAAACVGADYSNLGLLSADATTLRLFHGPFLDQQVADRYVDIPLDAPFPIAAAIRQRQSITLDGREAYREHFPAIWEDTAAAGIEATVSVPLSRSDGSRFGALGFAWRTPPAFDLKLDTALQGVAQLVTEIIERAELYEAEHQLIADLHLKLLSPIPEIAGIRTAEKYLPAGQSAAVGGDWFEGSVLDDGRLAVVVGDVTGHGLGAAADMALIRGMITALLHDGVAVADVFSRVSRILSRRPENLLATAVLAVIDRTAQTVLYATAGHPPPLLALPDGSVVRLDQANSPLLGLDRTRRVAETVSFPVGSKLVMYTDGLVERRDRPFSTGVDEAVEVLARQPASATPAALISALLDSLIGTEAAHDDIAVVVIEHVA